METPVSRDAQGPYKSHLAIETSTETRLLGPLVVFISDACL